MILLSPSERTFAPRFCDGRYNDFMIQSERLLREIAEDHRSGATELTRRAGEALLLFLEEHPHAPPGELARFAERLTGAQPAMASIRNLARRTLEARKKPADLPAVRETVHGFLKALEQSPTRIAERALPLIPKGARLLTISYSSAVFSALKRAQEEGKGISVVCPESRPLREGLRLAQELARLGVDVTVCVDALAPALVGECDLVLVGGDALAPEGLANKCGTLPLALAAHHGGKPFVAAISRLKFSERFEHEWVREMPPEEVLNDPQLKARVINRYFDLTPLELVTHIVTESEILRPEEVRRRLQRL